MNKRRGKTLAEHARTRGDIRNGSRPGRTWTTIVLGGLMALVAVAQAPAEGLPVADGLYTVTGVALEVDANGVFTGRQLRRAFPSLVYVQATPTHFFYRYPMGGGTFTLPCVGTTPLNGHLMHVYRYPSGALAVVADNGDIFNYGQFPNGQTFAIPLLKGDVRTDLTQGVPEPRHSPGSRNNSSAKTAANPWDALAQAAFDPSVSTGDFMAMAAGYGFEVNPLETMPFLPPEFTKLEMMGQMFPLPSGRQSSSSTDWDAKLQEDRDAMHEREMSRIGRHAPEYVSKYGTGPTGTTITWDPEAAIATGTTLVPWNIDMAPFF